MSILGDDQDQIKTPSHQRLGAEISTFISFVLLCNCICFHLITFETRFHIQPTSTEE